MKILLVSRFFPFVGGREVLVLSLAHALSKKHQVVLATPDVGRVSQNFEIISNETRTLSNFIEHYKPDIINSHTFYLTPPVLKIAKSKNISTILTVHGDIFGYGSDDDKKLLKTIGAKLDGIVAVCRHGMGQLTSNGVRPRHQRIIYPGVNLDLFRKLPIEGRVFKEEFQIPSNKFVFITPARMTQQKGIEVLLNAIARLSKPIREKSLFWIATPATRYREGELDYTKQVFKLAKRLGIYNDVLLSFIDFSSMPFVYNAANAFILPSLTEQLPVSIVEAMASKIPVIATAVGGVPEILSETTGFITRPNSADDLAMVITKVVKAREPISSRIEKAYELVKEEFELTRMVDEYATFYKEVIRSN